MDEEQERMFEAIRENSLRAKQHKNAERVKATDIKYKREKKNRFWKRVRLLLIIGAVLTTLGISVNALVEARQRQKDLNAANDYMNVAINYVCPDLDRGVLSDNTVFLFDNSQESLGKISDELISEFGLSRDCAIYCISKKYGDDGFDKIAKYYGYEDKEDFLYERYAKPISISSSGETVYTKEGSYKVFENNVQVELVNKVDSIKKAMDEKSKESIGKVL